MTARKSLRNGGYSHYLPGVTSYDYSLSFLSCLSECMYKNGRHSTEVGPPAGYTYLAQFVAHDLTHIQGSNIEAHGEPQDITTIRSLSTPQLDLGPLYGTGIDDPHISVDDSGYFNLGDTEDANGHVKCNGDLKRDNKKAVIADRRNDDNFILAQLHLLFMRAHNAIVENYFSQFSREHAFYLAKATLSHIYHKIVVHDLLAKLCEDRIWSHFFESGGKPIWRPKRNKAIDIPVEFAAAIFRFGHSMVQSFYSLNSSNELLISELIALTGDKDLNGRARIPTESRIDWEHFFLFPDSTNKPQSARGLSPSFVTFASQSRLRSSSSTIAHRNLKRANQMQCPSAQNLINIIKQSVKLPFKINLLEPSKLNPRFGSRHLLDNLCFKFKTEYYADTPLWTYILCEAYSHSNNGLSAKLGRLGSLIICDVIRTCKNAAQLPALPNQDSEISKIKSMVDLIQFFNLKKN